MARPRTLGPTVSFRLPIDLHAIADSRAQMRGQTVDEYLRERIVDALLRQQNGNPPTLDSVGSTSTVGRPPMVTTYFKESKKK